MASSGSAQWVKTRLSRLLRRIRAGAEIAGNIPGGVPVTYASPGPTSLREFGWDTDRLAVPDDLDAPLPDEIRRGFES